MMKLGVTFIKKVADLTELLQKCPWVSENNDVTSCTYSWCAIAGLLTAELPACSSHASCLQHTTDVRLSLDVAVAGEEADVWENKTKTFF